MSQNNFKNRRGKKYSNNARNQNDKVAEIDESNPIIAAFKGISLELDDKHDRYERIVKLSRDITIESKRIIFLLHTVDLRKEEESEKILKDAHNRLMTLCKVNFEQIAAELKGLDQYQYARSYSAGLQEFIEAFTFYEYISGAPIAGWEDYQKHLTYRTATIKEIDSEDVDDNLAVAVVEATPQIEFSCFIQPVEYMLGLGDLTGEIMRRGVNALGNSNFNVCFDSCKFLQHLYTGYMRINGIGRNREMSRKISTLRQSLLKTEMVCYNIRMRGGEAAKWGGTDAVGAASENFEIDHDQDEGFF